jgi:hypothetical protein
MIERGQRRTRAISRLFLVPVSQSSTWRLKEQGERAADRDRNQRERDGTFILVPSVATYRKPSELEYITGSQFQPSLKTSKHLQHLKKKRNKKKKRRTRV